MPSNENELPRTRAVSKVSELHPESVDRFWKLVERCLQEVFEKSKDDASQAVQAVRKKMKGLSEEAVLLTYHDSRVQTAANMIGTANRPLTDKELLAYHELLNANRKDRPSRDEILHGQHPRAG